MADKNDKVKRQDERAQARKLALAADLFLEDGKGNLTIEPPGKSIYDKQ